MLELLRDAIDKCGRGPKPLPPQGEGDASTIVPSLLHKPRSCHDLYVQLHLLSEITTGFSNPATNFLEIKKQFFHAGAKVLYQQESVSAMF